MSQAARYLFDLDFSAPEEPEVMEEIEEIPPEPMITVAEHERLLAAAKQQAHAEGEAKARDDREQLASEESLKVQQAMLNETAMIYTEVGTLLQRLERDASKLAFAFASRFAERLVAQEPKTEIQALLNQILAPLRQTPHISVRMSEAVADDIRIAVDQQMDELGFGGKLTILPDPTMMPGDCEVEWVDGGIGRNLRSAVRQVEQLLDDHFAHVPQAEEDDPEDAPEDTAETADEESPEGTSEESSEEHPEDASEEDLKEEEEPQSSLNDEAENGIHDQALPEQSLSESSEPQPDLETELRSDPQDMTDAEQMVEPDKFDETAPALPPPPSMLNESSEAKLETLPDASTQTYEQPLADPVDETTRQDAMGDPQ